MTYLKIYLDYLEATAPLDDAECGRLFRALLSYARTGAEPELSGNERYVFPLMKLHIDKNQESYDTVSEKRSAAAKLRWQTKSEEKANICSMQNANACNCIEEKEKEKEKEKDNIVFSNEKTARTRAHPPTVEEVAQYCRERENNVDPEQFVDYYTARGWKVSRGIMKDWRAAVRTWERNAFGREEAKAPPAHASSDAKGSFDTDDFFEAALRRSYISETAAAASQ